MPQRHIPCLMMRGGTSRAPYFMASDLPADRDAIARVLIAAMGAGSPLQVDGIGGGQATTSKVAILSISEHTDVDVDYLFAQVHAERAEVDFSPSCGNILAGVGPAAIELGLLQACDGITRVRIRNVNTDALIDANVQTPSGVVEYEGNARIDGVPGTAAPVILDFRNVIGSKTGKLLPTGNTIDVIKGTEITCIDVAMPMVIGRAADFGISGHESRDVIDADVRLFQKIEAIRLEAGRLMGLGDVSQSVVPKFGLLAAPEGSGAVCARYFMPWRTHPAYAVTGAICTACSLVLPGTVAEGLCQLPPERPYPLSIEHPTGAIDVLLDAELPEDSVTGEFALRNAGLLRTARRLFMGEVSIPASIG